MIAAVGSLALAAGPTPNNRADGNRGDTSANIQTAPNSIANSQAEAVKLGPDKKPCGDGEYNNQSDLCAQWYAARAAGDAARWAYWSLWVGIIGIIGLFITIRQTRHAIDADSRPWVHIIHLEINELQVAGVDPEIHWEGRVTIKNIGKTAAANLDVRWGMAGSIEGAAKLLSGADIAFTKPDNLLPDSPKTLDIGEDIPLSEGLGEDGTCFLVTRISYTRPGRARWQRRRMIDQCWSVSSGPQLTGDLKIDREYLAKRNPIAPDVHIISTMKMT